MAEIKSIKDKTPNEATVDMLQRMLERAKGGELRSIVCLRMWDDDTADHCWSMDSRNDPLRIVGEMAVLNFEFMANQSLLNSDLVLSRAFHGDA